MGDLDLRSLLTIRTHQVSVYLTSLTRCLCHELDPGAAETPDQRLSWCIMCITLQAWDYIGSWLPLPRFIKNMLGMSVRPGSSSSSSYRGGQSAMPTGTTGNVCKCAFVIMVAQIFHRIQSVKPYCVFAELVSKTVCLRSDSCWLEIFY